MKNAHAAAQRVFLPVGGIVLGFLIACGQKAPDPIEVEKIWGTFLRRDQDKRILAISANTADFGDSALRRFAACKDLEVLGLSDTSITDSGIAALPAMPNLYHVALDGTLITDEAVVALSQKAPNITFLALSRTAVSEKSIESFLNMRRLEFLGVRLTKITQEAVEALQAILPEVTIEWGP